MKNKKSNISLRNLVSVLFFGLILATVACSDDDKKVEIPHLEIEADELKIDRDGGVSYLEFSTNGAWTLNGPVWIEFSNKEGVAGGNQKIALTVGVNPTFEQRKSDIMIEVELNGQSISQKIPVLQSATQRFIAFDKDEVRESVENQRREILTVSSNIDWVYDDSKFPAWLDLVVKPGIAEDSKILEFMFQENEETTSEQVFELVLNDKGSDYSTSIRVIQLGAHDLLRIKDLFQGEIEFDFTGTEETPIQKTFHVVSTEKWQFYGLDAFYWLSAEVSESQVNGIFNSTVTIKALDNEGFEARSAFFGIESSTNAELYQPITVFQAPKPLVITFTPESMEQVAASGTNKKVNISEHMFESVEFSSTVDWVTVSEGATYGEFIIEVKPNQTGEARRTLIPVKFKDEYGDLGYYNEYSVSQKAN